MLIEKGNFLSQHARVELIPRPRHDPFSRHAHDRVARKRQDHPRKVYHQHPHHGVINVQLTLRIVADTVAIAVAAAIATAVGIHQYQRVVRAGENERVQETGPFGQQHEH